MTNQNAAPPPKKYRSSPLS